MSRHIIVVLLGVLLAAGVCSCAMSRAKKSNNTVNEQSSQTLGPSKASSSSRTPLGVGLELLQQVGASGVVVSPYSLAAALELAEIGSATDTKQALESFLQMAHREENVALMRRGAGGDSAKSLMVANAVWTDGGVTLHPAYAHQLATLFAAQAKTVPLSANPGQAAKTINSWVFDHTQGLIPELVDAAGVQGMRLVLTNALYFKGEWLYPFPKAQTVEGDFYTTKGTVRVPLMQMKEQIAYAENAHFQAITLPYRDFHYGMLILLPKVDAQRGYHYDWKGLGAHGVNELLDSLTPCETTVVLPRFSVASHLELTPALSRLGLKEALGSQADFSLMTTNAERLSISEVIQATRVDVNETTTEAAAATAIAMRCMLAPGLPKTFLANHPFLFAIYRTDPRNALIVGVYEPAQ